MLYGSPGAFHTERLPVQDETRAERTYCHHRSPARCHSDSARHLRRSFSPSLLPTGRVEALPPASLRTTRESPSGAVSSPAQHPEESSRATAEWPANRTQAPTWQSRSWPVLRVPSRSRVGIRTQAAKALQKTAPV